MGKLLADLILKNAAYRSQSFSDPAVPIFLVIWDFRMTAIILLTRKLDNRHTKIQPL